MAQNQKIRPLDYYKRRSRYLRRRYAKQFSVETWIGGELSEDSLAMKEYKVMRRPGEFAVLYVLYYARGSEKRILAVYDDMHVAYEVSRIAHEVYRLVRLEFRRRKLRRRRCKSRS